MAWPFCLPLWCRSVSFQRKCSQSSDLNGGVSSESDTDEEEVNRMLEEAGIKHDVASSPRTSTAGTSSSSSSQGKIQTKVGLGMQQSNSGKSGARSPRTIAEKAKARLFRTLSGGVLQTRAAPWY